ncbi:hypothetical protein TNCV_3332011 [Trichonephila clavipes]|nr:hypothetical protein TNCV_3332011 [Trichonephila clavipes]
MNPAVTSFDILSLPQFDWLEIEKFEIWIQKFIETRKNLHSEIAEVEIEVVSPSIVPSGNFAELNRTVTCMVLKANDRRTSCPCHDDFRGPRSDYVRQVQHLWYRVCDVGQFEELHNASSESSHLTSVGLVA